MHDPSAVTTFLFTDIEGSTRLWEQEPERMRRRAGAPRRDRARERSSAVRRHGREDDRRRHARGVRTIRSTRSRAARARCSSRSPTRTPTDGIALARALRTARRRGRAARQRLLRQRRQPRGAHHERRARRPGAACRRPSPRWSRDRLPDGVALRDLGAVRLRDLAEPEHVYQVVHPELRAAVSRAALARGDAEQPAAAAHLVRRPRARAGRGRGSCSARRGC